MFWSYSLYKSHKQFSYIGHYKSPEIDAVMNHFTILQIDFRSPHKFNHDSMFHTLAQFFTTFLLNFDIKITEKLSLITYS